MILNMKIHQIIFFRFHSMPMFIYEKKNIFRFHLKNLFQMQFCVFSALVYAATAFCFLVRFCLDQEHFVNTDYLLQIIILYLEGFD